MPDEIRISRAPNPPRPEQSMSTSDYRSGDRSKLPWIILIVVIIVLAALGVLFRDKLFNTGKNDVDAAKTSGYQAVFLTNGQVYFGKLTNADKQYVTLKDIYYLQVTAPATAQATPQTPAQQQQLSLVKLGQELHGPLDTMEINRDQILFFEDMKEDSQVMVAVRKYQKDPPAANQNSQTPAATLPAGGTQTPTPAQ